MKILSTRFAVGVGKGVAAILLAGFSIVALREILAHFWQVHMPPMLDQMLVIVAVFGAIWLGSGKFIRELEEEHKKEMAEEQKKRCN